VLTRSMAGVCGGLSSLRCMAVACDTCALWVRWLLRMLVRPGVNVDHLSDPS
jgi:hypothetical protein